LNLSTSLCLRSSRGFGSKLQKVIFFWFWWILLNYFWWFCTVIIIIIKMNTFSKVFNLCIWIIIAIFLELLDKWYFIRWLSSDVNTRWRSCLNHYRCLSIDIIVNLIHKPQERVLFINVICLYFVFFLIWLLCWRRWMLFLWLSLICDIIINLIHKSSEWTFFIGIAVFVFLLYWCIIWNFKLFFIIIVFIFKG